MEFPARLMMTDNELRGHVSYMLAAPLSHSQTVQVLRARV
jgi:hypothetical protein